MSKLMTAFKNFVQDEEGVTAIEYALIAALIAVVIIVAVRETGVEIRLIFEQIRDELRGA